MKTSNAITVAAAAVLTIALTGGVAVGAGKITSKQIAKNAVLAKHIKAGAVGTEDLADGAVSGTKLADGAVTGPKITGGAITGPKLADGAVTGPKLADGSVTGAKVDEATLGAVPNALAVGGVTVVPVSVSMAADTPLVEINANGLRLLASCQGGSGLVSVEFSAPGGSPITVDATREGQAPFTENNPAGSSTQLVAISGHYAVTVTRASGGFTMLELSAFYAANAIGADDCFFRGTLSSTP